MTDIVIYVSNKFLKHEINSTWKDLKKYHEQKDIDKVFIYSGRMVEDIFRLFYFLHHNRYVPEIKPKEFQKIKEIYFKKDSKEFPDSMRIIIPSLLDTVYTIRSKFDVLHRKDIQPSFYDCIFIMETIRWILIQLMRFNDISDKEIEKILVYNFQEPQQEIIDYVISNIDKYNNKQITCIGLLLKKQLTNIELINLLNECGKNGNTYVKSKLYLLKKERIIKKVGEYNVLTHSGVISATKLINTIKSNLYK